MKTLKAVGLFIAGGATSLLWFAYRAATNTEYPREGAIVYEDDNIKVTRINTVPSDNLDLATIVHKKKD